MSRFSDWNPLCQLSNRETAHKCKLRVNGFTVDSKVKKAQVLLWSEVLHCTTELLFSVPCSASFIGSSLAAAPRMSHGLVLHGARPYGCLLFLFLAPTEQNSGITIIHAWLTKLLTSKKFCYLFLLPFSTPESFSLSFSSRSDCLSLCPWGFPGCVTAPYPSHSERCWRLTCFFVSKVQELKARCHVLYLHTHRERQDKQIFALCCCKRGLYILLFTIFLVVGHFPTKLQKIAAVFDRVFKCFMVGYFQNCSMQKTVLGTNLCMAAGSCRAIPGMGMGRLLWGSERFQFDWTEPFLLMFNCEPFFLCAQKLLYPHQHHLGGL